MAWYADGSPCDYFGANAAKVLRAVGWLKRGQPYTVGEVGCEVYDRLKGLLFECWQPAVSAGVHACDLCRIESQMSGTRNLFVPADGFLYVCPESIVHYMNAHDYAPPADFCERVLSCPPMNSMEYRRALLANGGSVLIRLLGT